MSEFFGLFDLDVWLDFDFCSEAMGAAKLELFLGGMMRGNDSHAPFVQNRKKKIFASSIDDPLVFPAQLM